MSNMDAQRLKKVRLLNNKIMVTREVVPVHTGQVFLPNQPTKDNSGIGYLYEDTELDDGKYPAGTKIIFKTFSGYDVDSDHVAIDPNDIIAIWEVHDESKS